MPSSDTRTGPPGAGRQLCQTASGQNLLRFPITQMIASQPVTINTPNPRSRAICAQATAPAPRRSRPARPDRPRKKGRSLDLTHSRTV